MGQKTSSASPSDLIAMDIGEKDLKFLKRRLRAQFAMKSYSSLIRITRNGELCKVPVAVTAGFTNCVYKNSLRLRVIFSNVHSAMMPKCFVRSCQLKEYSFPISKYQAVNHLMLFFIKFKCINSQRRCLGIGTKCICRTFGAPQ